MNITRITAIQARWPSILRATSQMSWLTTRWLLPILSVWLGQAVAGPKNFIVVLTDDQGWGDLGSFGSEKIKTPHLDQMAAEGMRMTDFYVASSVCTPSRAALLTGRMPVRTGVTEVLFPRSRTGMPPEEITIAEILKTKGYATGLVGKWHLGHKKQFMPTNQGFDSYIGIPYSNDMSITGGFDISPDIQLNDGYTLEKLNADIKVAAKNHRAKQVHNKLPLLRDNTIIEYPIDQREITRRYTEESIEFIEANKEDPFFLYLAHTMPHRPHFVEDAFAGRSDAGRYGDIIEHLDWSVGQILQTLRDNGLAEETLVLFTSDNGPTSSGSAGPLRGIKFSTFEGGVRVPSIVWAPGTVPTGQVSGEIVSILDLLPTIAHYAGAELPDDRIYDGHDLSAFLEGKSEESPRDEIFYYAANREEITGVRIGKWKYLKWGQNPRERPKNPTPALYDLQNDVGETTNLLDQNPEIAERLIQRMREFDSTARQK